MARPEIRKWRVEDAKCPQKRVIKKDNDATKQRELYESFVIWKYFDKLNLKTHFASYFIYRQVYFY